MDCGSESSVWNRFSGMCDLLLFPIDDINRYPCTALAIMS